MLKKFSFSIMACALSLIASLSGQASNALNLQSFTKIDCEVEQITPLSVKYQSLPKSRHAPSPHIHIEEGTSLNWSGYVAVTSLGNPKKGSVSSVIGSWTVPTLHPTLDNSYSSIWVGIDGYNNGTVEQIGTEHDWVFGIGQENYVWFEMYPRGMYQLIGFPVNNGDVMGAEVSYMSRNTFNLSVINYTQGVYTVIPKRYTQASAQRSSAEWIVEAPYYLGVLPLANFNTVTFANCEAMINGKVGTIGSKLWMNDPLTMKTTTSAIKAVPSSLTPKGDGFSIAWEHE